jgi:adenylate kinase
MRLLLIGAPGSGKGTQAVRIAETLGITHISSGDLLRQHVTEGTAFGQQVQQYVSRGDLVPDQMVLDMLRKPIVAASEAGGYVLDGFPRTVEQAKVAYDTARALGVAVQIAIHLHVPTEELVRRLLARGRGSDDTQ